MSIAVNLILGNHATNIGNAFLDMGSEASIRKACPDVVITRSSSFPAWFAGTQLRTGLLRTRQSQGFFSIAYRIPSDFAVFSGMVISEGFVTRYGAIIRKLRERGVRIILNGAGPGEYSSRETKVCTRFWTEVGLYAIISRDKVTFETYGEVAEHAYDGIDCGFFVNDAFVPVQLAGEDFDVHAFDHMREPQELPTARSVVRTHHRFYPNVGLKNENDIHKENTFISEHAPDYLQIYANARAVYTDRVHACVAAAAFGTPFTLITDSNRALLFERLGVNLGEMRRNLVTIDENRLQTEKECQVKYLRTILASE